MIENNRVEMALILNISRKIQIRNLNHVTQQLPCSVISHQLEIKMQFDEDVALLIWNKLTQ